MAFTRRLLIDSNTEIVMQRPARLDRRLGVGPGCAGPILG